MKMTTDDLRKKLEVEKTLLESDLRTVADPDKSIPGNWKARFPEVGSDGDENAQEISEYQNNVAQEQEMEKRLAEVNHALEKIASGNYGTCESCNETIKPERLAVNPATRYCTAHAQQ